MFQFTNNTIASNADRNKVICDRYIYLYQYMNDLIVPTSFSYWMSYGAFVTLMGESILHIWFKHHYFIDSWLCFKFVQMKQTLRRITAWYYILSYNQLSVHYDTYKCTFCHFWIVEAFISMSISKIYVRKTRARVCDETLLDCILSNIRRMKASMTGQSVVNDIEYERNEWYYIWKTDFSAYRTSHTLN